MDGLHVSIISLVLFVILFVVFVYLGFYGSRWRRGDLSKLHEWALAGRRLGPYLMWFLLTADLYTAYTFIAVPSLVLASGPVGFFAAFYSAVTPFIALLFMPRLWTIAKNKGYVTAADFIKDRFNNKILAGLVAITGVVAELPYIALQIVGMQVALLILLLGLGVSNVSLASDLSLLVAFIILAAFVFTSGLRGAALTAVYKDIIILGTVISIAIYVPLAFGGFSGAFHNALTLSSQINLALNNVNKPIFYNYLPNTLAAQTAYISLAIGSAFALYLYPHAVNASVSSDSKKSLKLSLALQPFYSIILAIIALFGILVYANPNVVSFIAKTHSGAVAVPALIGYSMPDWFVGIALLGIFIGGLVPAAIMAIGAANLLTRNIIKEFKPNMSPSTESALAKWISTAFKFLALALVFATPSTYAIQLQLLGGIIILQTLPSVFLGLYTNKLNGYALVGGWAGGMFSGIYLTLLANHFGPLKTSSFLTPLGPMYIGVISTLINLAIGVIGTAIAYGVGWRPVSNIRAEEIG
ncbi:Na+/solute symporter [Saccharolobus shibatae B12]|uniref:Na+/solute symporter n=1 Tax=Saccharolobus shibatae (strain ATCC 51178 / DSM 5389 / JCM 8931 / NBRC 15437 / B12) TaxID=523848 RepID=A0A8F5GTM0_SACSH|nr:sodium:solute symporter [Saccharolobus shibatae]QXJ29099.1 Na+/solute symporter [Saccharolobus shibatae B12]